MPLELVDLATGVREVIAEAFPEDSIHLFEYPDKVFHPDEITNVEGYSEYTSIWAAIWQTAWRYAQDNPTVEKHEIRDVTLHLNGVHKKSWTLEEHISVSVSPLRGHYIIVSESTGQEWVGPLDEFDFAREDEINCIFTGEECPPAGINDINGIDVHYPVFKKRELTPEEVLAEEKAEKLLRQNLSFIQLVEYSTHGYFHCIVGSHLYRVNKGWSGNVELRTGDNHGVYFKFCIHPEIETPHADNMLAIKLMLETEEDEFLRIANKWEAFFIDLEYRADRCIA